MLTIPLSLLAIHFVADFLLQSDWMALNKSKSWKALCTHGLVYSVCFSWLGVAFFIVTFLTHTFTDMLTSRITSRLWFVDLRTRGDSSKKLKWPYFAYINPKKRHWFFVMIGFDQLIHFTTLGLTYKYLFGG